jgi:hypothetical protein
MAAAAASTIAEHEEKRVAAERAAALAAQDAAAQARHRPLSAPQRSTFEAEVTGLRTESLDCQPCPSIS